MNYTEYIESKRKAAKKISADIRERWNNRIVTRGLHLLGEPGAIQYLSDYGRGIGTAKVISFALCAEAEGYPEIAAGFWQKAFELETGEKATAADTKNTSTTVTTTPKSTKATPKSVNNSDIIPELPPHLQPGRIVTMQPVDAPSERSYYIENPEYWGQPKRDGNRVIIIATKDKIYYQSRSTNLRQQPSIEIQKTLQQILTQLTKTTIELPPLSKGRVGEGSSVDAVNQLGTFILDGELYYKSYNGSEHRTGSQAATVNIENGFPTTQPQVVYAIFKSLFFNGNDLTTATESARIEAGVTIGELLIANSPEFEIVPTAKTLEEKLLLANKQQTENREGEVWILHNCQYIGGKNIRTFPMVRTKYCIEFDLLIVGLTKTKVAGRPFSAIEVAQEKNGKLVPMGTVGTGFNMEEMEEIARRYTANPHGVKIKVRSQGLTESGLLWHARFLEFTETVDS
jgi:hypothetical protein